MKVRHGFHVLACLRREVMLELSGSRHPPAPMKPRFSQQEQASSQNYSTGIQTDKMEQPRSCWKALPFLYHFFTKIVFVMVKPDTQISHSSREPERGRALSRFETNEGYWTLGPRSHVSSSLVLC